MAYFRKLVSEDQRLSENILRKLKLSTEWWVGCIKLFAERIYIHISGKNMPVNPPVAHWTQPGTP